MYYIIFLLVYLNPRCVNVTCAVPKDQMPPRDVSISASGEYDHSELQKLTEYRQRHRKTINGQLCAAAFVRNGNKFTDCTTTEAPDGSVGMLAPLQSSQTNPPVGGMERGREWCYVEVQLIGTGIRDWDFCTGVVDYDILRSKAVTLAQLRTIELSDVGKSLAMEERRLDDALSKYEEVCGKSESLYNTEFTRIDTLLRGVERAIDQLKANISAIATLLEKLRALDDEVQVSRKSSLNNRKNCALVRGYDALENQHDGLRASYYNNPYFRGPPVGFLDHSNVNMIWEDFVPVEGVRHESFSVRIEGYIRIPSTDVYTFYIKSDCNVRVFMDNEIIISQGFDDSTFDGTYGPVNTLPIDGRNTTNLFLKSKPIHLTGGKHYSIVIEYSHQKILKYYNSDLAKLIFSWSSNHYAEEVVPPESFFKSSNQHGTLTVSGLKGEFYTLALLESGAQAFNDVSYFVIADVPARLIGARMIRTSTKPVENKITFSISNDGYIYAAIPTSSKYIPTSDGVPFEKTSDVMSIYGVENYCTKASSQDEFTLYVMRFKKGIVNVTLPEDTSYLIFITPAIFNGLCKGDVSILKLNNDQCVTSSSLNEVSGCVEGFGIAGDETSGWVTDKGRTVGEFIARDFDKMVELRHFHFKPRGTLRATGLLFSFPDGTTESFELNDQLRYEFDVYRMVNHVRIQITSVEELDGSDHTTGGIITLFGIVCTEYEADNEVRDINISFCIDGNCADNSLVDAGFTKGGHHGIYYGWEHRAVTDTCTHKGLVLYNNKWSIDAPAHGKYHVKVKVGTYCNEIYNANLTINNYEVLNGEHLKKGQALTVGYGSL